MKFKKHIVWGLSLLSITGLKAQGSLINNGANITINSGIDLRVEGAVRNENNGSINNNGSIYLNNDWNQTGLTTAYLGNGALWFEGSSNQQIISNAPLTLGSLNIDNNNKVILNNVINISSQLNLNNNGQLELGIHNLNLQPSASILNYDENNYIITNNTGKLSQTVGPINTDFPIGNSSYNPATLHNIGTVDDFSVRVIDEILEDGITGAPFISEVVNRTWDIEEATIGGSNISLSLQWNEGQELTNFIRTASGIIHYTGGAWDNSLGFGTATDLGGNNHTVTGSNITSFSPFGVATQSIDLPVELLRFDANRESPTLVLLNWETASEINNKGFHVERMLDTESEFSIVGWINGNGTSTANHFYDFEDFNAHPGISYYRLRQIDFDETESYSLIRAVEGDPIDLEFALFPNPTTQATNLMIKNVDNSSANIRIIDALGKVVHQKATVIRNQKIIPINHLEHLSPGIYTVNIQLKDGRHLDKQLIIQEP